MKLNEQIREHRKKVGLTQEQVANYLGVSTPAVNKWESGSTYPYITFLAPLARLLKIDMNTLFTFPESLSKEEVGRFCNQIGEVVQAKGFQAGFSAATTKLQEYPNCDHYDIPWPYFWKEAFKSHNCHLKIEKNTKVSY